MYAFDGRVPAVLLRLDRNPFHHGTLGAVRSLGREGVEVHAVAEAGAGPVGRSRYLRATHPGPAGGLDLREPEALVECLGAVAERIGRPAVLFAMDDLSAISVSRLAPVLTDRFRMPHQPNDLPARVADKAELARLCARWGIPHPETVIPQSAAEAGRAVWELGLPVVAKWSRPWLLPAGSGLRSTTLVDSAAGARALYERSAEAGSRLLLQRFLPAGPDTDWFFHGAFARGGRPLLTGTGRKELAWPVRAGLTAVGRWLTDPALEESGLRLAERLGYEGILDLDFRRDERGTFRLVDFNPRPGAQFRLFTDDTGLDVVRAMYLDLTHQHVPQRTGGPGRVFVTENYALLATLRTRTLPPLRGRDPSGTGGAEAATGQGSAESVSARSGDAPSGPARPGPVGASVGEPGRGASGCVAVGEVTGPGCVPSGSARPGPVRASAGERGRVEAAWFAADDPGPFLAMLRAFLGRGLGKGARALRGVPAQGRRTALGVWTPRQRGGEGEPCDALATTAPTASAPTAGSAAGPVAGLAAGLATGRLTTPGVPAPSGALAAPASPAEPDELVSR
ncbi:ATP-grasp domain-containing protein [Streptomyces sp. NPDC006662]|uniref:ATP-grasp domain-containing protein n=1 Tax=Streptomyces sp. NPDC006662 TaxID=3156902 RepID=UPI0033F4BC3B